MPGDSGVPVRAIARHRCPLPSHADARRREWCSCQGCGHHRPSGVPGTRGSCVRPIAVSPARARLLPAIMSNERSTAMAAMPDGSSNALAALNEAQQSVVAFGGAGPHAPLLVIAGAGTGKTNTIAHRVGRLIRDGADPNRILLLTFSRRAAAELESRAGRVRRNAPAQPQRRRSGRAAVGGHVPQRGRQAAASLRGAHCTCTRIHHPRPRRLRGPDGRRAKRARDRRHAAQVPVRRRLHDDLLARRQRAATRSPTSCGETFPRWVEWEAELAHSLPPTSMRSRRSTSSTSTTSCCIGMPCSATRRSRAKCRPSSITCSSTSTRIRIACKASILARLKPTGAGVTVVGDDAQAIYGFRAAEVRNILDFPSLFDPPATTMTLDVNYRSAQAILDASNAVMADAAERFTKSLTGVRGIGERPLLVTVKDESEQARYVCGGRARVPRAGHAAQVAGRAVPNVEPQRTAGARARASQHPVREVRRTQVPRRRAREGRPVRAALGAQPARSPRRLSRACDCCRASARRTRRASATAWPARGRRRRRSAAARVCATLAAARRAAAPRLRAPQARWPADVDDVLAWYEPHLMRIHEDGPSRALDLSALSRIAATYPSRERFLTEITLDPPSAASAMADAPSHRRRLPHPVDHPLRERAGVAQREHPERRGRMHPVGHGDRPRRGHRGRAPAAVRRHDPRARPPCDRRAAALLRRAAVARRRPARLRVAQPVSHRSRCATRSTT